jgi:hypothetical protein
LIFASSADDSANDLPLKAVYAPFWQQMLRYLENYKERRHSLQVGDTIDPREILAAAAVQQGRVGQNFDESFAVLDPVKKRVAAKGDADRLPLEKTGFYEIRAMNLNAAVAVNTVPKESDLSHGNAEEMIAGWASSKPAVFPQDDRLSSEEQEKRQRVWSFLLISGALFLILEMFFSYLMSEKRRSADNRRQGEL